VIELMDRRAFIGGLALVTIAVPRAAASQPARRVYRIGILIHGSTTADVTGPQPRSRFVDAFLRGMRDLGYQYGQHFVTESRGGDGRPERFSDLAAELVRLPVDVIVAPGPVLRALKRTTLTIPIGMSGSTDPLVEGLVQSLGHPGGNFTGLSLQSVELTGKRLELLKETVPAAALVAVLGGRDSLSSRQAAETAARERGWKLLSLEVRDAGEIEGAFQAATDARAGALLVVGGGLVDGHARRIAELAGRSRLPTMYTQRFYVDAGGLICYTADLIEIWRRAAVFVDKIFKGAKPAGLPIEQPSKFELVINLKAAKALGQTIPPSLLLRADHVIQ
jgi:putative ABC transport system substrate-binding protein